jgi:hypothetical protein
MRKVVGMRKSRIKKEKKTSLLLATVEERKKRNYQKGQAEEMTT